MVEGKTRRGIGRLVWTVVLVLMLVGFGLIFAGVERPWVLWGQVDGLGVGEVPHWSFSARLGMGVAALMGMLVTVVLLLTVRWWAKPGQRAGVASLGEEGVGSCGWVYWVVLALLVVGAMALRVPLAEKSLWWDELWQVKKVTTGEWRTGSAHPDELRFYEADWFRTLHYYEKPTNHPASAAAQRVAVAAYGAAVGGVEEGSRVGSMAAPNWVYRLPSLVATVVGMVLLAALMRALGLGWAGLVAVAWMGVQPWLIRYGVEGRGYAILVPGMLVALLALVWMGRAPWRWAPWVLLLVAEVVMMWAWPMAVLFVAVLAAGALVVAWRGGLVVRWLAMQALGAVVTIQLLLPNALAMLHWANHVDDRHVPPAARVMGLTVIGLEPGQWLWAADVWWLAGVMGVLFVFGLARLWGRGGVLVWVMPLLLVMGVLYVWGSKELELFFYTRFVVLLAPVVLVGVVAGLLGWAGRGWRVAAALLALVLVGGQALLARGQIEAMLRLPIEPQDEVAGWLGERLEGVEGAWVAAFGHGCEVIDVYDHRIAKLRDLGALEAKVAAAREVGEVLYVAVSQQGFNRGRFPEAMALLESGEDFEKVAEFEGLEERLGWVVYRLRGGGGQGAG